MDTKKYEVLEKTVELSSLTKAAQELGLTQSGVSHMLAAIEAELQLPLLKRTRTGARLTPEGEQMMPYIHEIVRQEKLLRQAAAALHTLVTGKIRIGTFTSVATHWLPAMMMQFQQAYPQVDFQLFNGDYHDIDTWLGAGSVDLAFTTLPARPGCSCVPLYEDALAAVLPRGIRGRRSGLPGGGAGKGAVHLAAGILQPRCAARVSRAERQAEHPL